MIANKIESYVQCGNCNQSVCHRSEAHHHKDRTDFEEPFMPSLCINQKIVKNQSELDVNSFWCDRFSTFETAGCDKIFRALRASGHHNFWRKLVVRFGEFITEGLLQLLWH